MKKKPLCFVIMGFGKKTDPSTGRTIDLDKTYKNVIKPVVKSCGLECIRGDEVQDSRLIDKTMYALLMHSELVIADISTYNPNAIYELGVRHAVKPFSTIIIKEEKGEIPFDLNHTRIFSYSHLGEDIGHSEVERCKKELKSLIQEVIKNKHIDSPLYEHISVDPPKLDEKIYRDLVKDLAEREKHIFALVEHAREKMSEDDFISASELWEKASKRAENEPYFIQQWALTKYKSEHPSKQTALMDALGIIQKLSPDGDTNDPETLGITGAIYKRLYLLEKDEAMLDRAIKYYGKCFNINSDYYTGENYALCLELKADLSKGEEKVYYKFQAKKVRDQIISILEKIIESDDFEQRIDKKWIYATLSHCYLSLDRTKLSEEFETKFKNENPDKWEIKTFNDSKKLLKP